MTDNDPIVMFIANRPGLLRQPLRRDSTPTRRSWRGVVRALLRRGRHSHPVPHSLTLYTGPHPTHSGGRRHG